MFRATRAISLAKLGQHDQAKTELLPLTAMLRGKLANGSDSQEVRLNRARALYGMALAQGRQGDAELKESKRLVAGLAPEMQPFQSVTALRKEIAAEMQYREL